MRNHKLLVATLFSFLLTACGGGGLGNGSTTGGSTGGAADSTASSLVLQASATQLSSDAADVSKGITLKAIVKDANNNVVAGAPITFSTDSGEITVTNGTTDSTGRALATLTTGGDPTNRTLTVKATTPGLSAVNVAVAVVGTSVGISGLANTQINVNTTYTVLVTNAANQGIPNVLVTASAGAGNVLTPASPFVANASGQVPTNSSGQVVYTLNATQAVTTISATALGVLSTKTVNVSTDEFTFVTPVPDPAVPTPEVTLGTSQPLSVQWKHAGVAVADGTVVNFTKTRGTLSAASATTVGGIATVSISSTEASGTLITATGSGANPPTATQSLEFVATTPASVDLQLSPATIATNQTSEVSVVVRDAANNLVKNITVDFSLQDITGGVISPSQAVTNSQGLAKVTYTSTSQSSSKDGVKITATVSGSSPSITDLATLTVGSRAISIRFGGGAEVVPLDTSTYALPFTVVVTDSAGNPVPDATFRLQLFPLIFYKGTRPEAEVVPTPTAQACFNEDRNRNGILDTVNEDTNSNGTLDGNEDVNHNGVLDPAEDLNGNGVLDLGEDANDDGQFNFTEDTNGNGSLDPGIFASVPATITLADDGHGQFNVTYPKEFGDFAIVQITAIASVAGTEATAVRNIQLPVAAGDVVHLPFNSPFGIVHNCATSN